MQLLKLMRIKQWAKNIFVYTGLIFSEKYNDIHFLIAVTLAAIAFSFVSSSVYVINDIVDRDSDKMHPKKRYRPLAAGTVSITAAVILAAALFIGGLGLGYYVSPAVACIILVYVVINTLYSFKLKNIVILDVFCISAGFMLRIFAGTIGVGIPPSKWLLLCGLMITLFLGFAKRRAELIAFSSSGTKPRQVLQNYGGLLLDELIAICATGVIIGYSLYTMDPETVLVHKTQSLIYTVPFVIYALFRYIYILHHGEKAEDPSTDIFTDKHILVSVIAWAGMTLFIFTAK
ncbi:MAG: decaprenyl-phosphate phosphoribosyltransferase [Chlamydiales bacterium]|nr:decaprenyl-phosphate phosphoribosyltransferase [Chlamydiia bacterium]MCP5508055.1 decaprenyl-phosphate phosphoribosyltransferase [Chlamydiales bacterium]